MLTPTLTIVPLATVRSPVAFRSTLPLTLEVFTPETAIVAALAVMLLMPPSVSKIGPSVSPSPGKVAASAATLPVRLMSIVANRELVGEPFW